MELKTPVTDFRFSYIEDLVNNSAPWSLPINTLSTPIRVELPVANINRYSQAS